MESKVGDTVLGGFFILILYALLMTIAGDCRQPQDNVRYETRVLS